MFGLRSLLEVAGYKNIDSNAISFGISPRINACGRMGHQEKALELFLTDDPIQARKLAGELEEFNVLRQETEKNIYKEAIELIEAQDINKEPCIVLGKEDWHHGVIGIVSSKVTEKYYKPSILVCFEENDARGSGRGIEGFDMHEGVLSAKEYLTACGGHQMAIGLSLETKNFDKFKEKFEEYAKTHITEEMVPILQIDEIVSGKDLSVDAVKELSILEPFGESNSQPIFMYKSLKISSIRSLTDGKHLKLTLVDENIVIDCIGFNMGELADTLFIGDKVDVVGNLEINNYNNQEKIQINLKDIRKTIS